MSHVLCILQTYYGRATRGGDMDRYKANNTCNIVLIWYYTNLDEVMVVTKRSGLNINKKYKDMNTNLRFNLK